MTTTEKTGLNLQVYYSKFFVPKTVNEEIELIVRVYSDRIQLANDTTIEGIREYYNILNERGADALLWLLEAITCASKKHGDKRNFGYIVGMLRNWMKNGFGHIPSQEFDQVCSFIEEDFDISLSREARQQVSNLLGKHGAVAVTRALSKAQFDISNVLIQAIDQHISQNKLA